MDPNFEKENSMEKQDNETLFSSTNSYAETHNGKTEKHFEDAPGSTPDIDHEEVERMDALHEEDLERGRSHDIDIAPIKSSSKAEHHDLERTSTRNSIGSRLSKVVTGLSRKSKKGGLEPEKIPVSNLDAGIVGWESQDDPEMPLNFPNSRKYLLLGLLSSVTIISPLASSMFAPGVSFMDKDFGNTSTILSALTVSIFVLGYVVGPIFLAPLCEIFGRRPVLTGANIFFVVWQIGCALAPNLGSLIGFRFLAGIGGSGCLTIGGGVISDLFHVHQRGSATAIYTLGPLFGPVIGPICGGFIAQRAGWRWVFWVLLIAGAIISACIEIFNRETNHRVLMLRKTRALRKSLNRPELQSCYDPERALEDKARILRSGLMRPLTMLFTSPIVFILSLYMAVVYGLLYLLFTTITIVFQETYGWAPDICGLAYIGLGVGFFASVSVVAKVSDATVVRMTKANNNVFEPEMRLPACIIFAFFIPISFFWYGWSAEKHAHWFSTLVSLVPFGFGMMGVFIPTQTYLIDSYPAFAASAIAALTISRSLFGALLPLAGPSMYKSLGLGWGNTTLGFIAVALIPAPALIYKFGARIRKGYPLKL